MLRRLTYALAAAIVLAACGSDGGTAATTTKGLTEPEKAELAFLTEMVPHHAQAVEMAQLCADRAAHPELEAFAQQIITAQQKEIGDMKAWAKQWYGAELAEAAPGGGHGGGHGGGGMQADDDVKALAGKSGPDFDRQFLEMMIAHHQGAVTSAAAVKDAAPHAEVRTLAGNIISSQEAEINQMKAWQQAWFS